MVISIQIPHHNINLMSRIEDEFKKKYGQQELSNDTYDTEGLWNTISEDLDKAQQSNGNGRGKLIFFFALIISITAGVTYHFMPKFNSHITSQESNTTADLITQTAETKASITAQESEQSNTNISTIEDVDTDSSDPLNENNFSTDPTNAIPAQQLKLNNSSSKNVDSHLPEQLLTSSLSSGKTNVPSNSANSIKHNTISTKETIAPNSEIDDNESIPYNTIAIKEYTTLEGSKNSNTASKSEAPKTKIESTTPTTIRPALNITKLTTLYPSQIESEFTLKIEDQLTDYEDILSQEPDNISWELSAWAGINTLQTKYNSTTLNDLASLKNKTDKSEIGSSFGLKTSLLWKKRYLISTGIEYHDMWSVFDVEISTPIQVLKENQLLNVWIEGTTGDTLHEEYGNILVNADSIHKVIHYNNYQRLSIPIELGVQHNTQKFVFGVSAGAILNFTRNQTGRTFNKNSEIVNFDKESTTRTLNPFSIGLRINPNIGYRIKNNWTIKFEPQWSWDSNSNFDGTDLKISTHQFNMNLGISYSFD